MVARKHSWMPWCLVNIFHNHGWKYHNVSSELFQICCDEHSWKMSWCLLRNIWFCCWSLLIRPVSCEHSNTVGDGGSAGGIWPLQINIRQGDLQLLTWIPNRWSVVELNCCEDTAARSGPSALTHWTFTQTLWCQERRHCFCLLLGSSCQDAAEDSTRLQIHQHKVRQTLKLRSLGTTYFNVN